MKPETNLRMNATSTPSDLMLKLPSPGLLRGLLSDPLLNKLSELAVKTVGMRLVVVYPSEKGLDQLVIGKSNYLNAFCKLIQECGKGADHCRICHLVMTRSSRPNAALVKRCHMGASALVRLVSGHEESSLGVLSSCCFIDQDADSSWDIAKRQGKELGLDEQNLRKAFKELPRLTADKAELANQIMGMASDALRLIISKANAESEVERERDSHTPEKQMTAMVEKEIHHLTSSLREKGKSRATPNRRKTQTGASPIDIISEVVATRPYLPYSLKTVAAVCRITPNHFSFLFHKRHNLCFSEYLTEQRLLYSKKLLKNLTLNISQVASTAGFQDAGYFARRFKQKNGVSPRQWRMKLER